MRGYKPLSVGMKVSVKLVNTDSVHGFIDFEFAQGDDDVPIRRVGDIAEGDVVRLVPGDIEGRLVRGRRGLSVGDETVVVLLAVDPVGGSSISRGRIRSCPPSDTRRIITFSPSASGTTWSQPAGRGLRRRTQVLASRPFSLREFDDDRNRNRAR